MLQLGDGVLQFAGPPGDPLFQVADADGWQRDRRQQTGAIVDFIDDNLDQAVPPGQPRSSASEDYDYSRMKYKAKNDYLDTVDEMRLIRGVDDRFWTLFGPAFTVYGVVGRLAISPSQPNARTAAGSTRARRINALIRTWILRRT